MRLIRCWNMHNKWDGGNMSYTEWNIIPNASVNELEFGMKRSVVWETLGKPRRVFRKSFNSANTTDDYSDFHVYYSAQDQLEAIEFFGNDICLFINSKQVFPGSLSTTKTILPDLEECFGSYISKAASIGIFSEDEEIESILVGCKDYYK